MNALLATVTCPTYAGPLTWRQSTRPTPTEASALLDCDVHGGWQVLTRMLAVGDDAGAARKARYRARQAVMA